MPTFSIGIPCYGHPDHVAITLMSIATQTHRDFNVWMFDDGSAHEETYKTLAERFSEFMPEPIHYLRFKNEGIAVQRQRILDNVDGEYVVMIDDDDALYHCEVLQTYKKNLDLYVPQGKLPDIMHGQFMEAHTSGLRNPHQPLEGSWLHGKAIRMKFIKDNKIAFDPSVKLFEDGQVVGLAMRLAQFQVSIPDVLYFWTATANSIVRSPEYIFRMLKYFALSFWVNYKFLEPLKGRDNIADLMITMAVMCYYYLQGLERRFPADAPEIVDTYKVLKEALTTSNVIDLINTNDAYYQLVKTTLQTGRAGAYAQDPYMIESESFNNWLNKHFNLSIKQLEEGAMQGIRPEASKDSMFQDQVGKK
jgi:glycosyltransferase involved in cell wall biosynthesis